MSMDMQKVKLSESELKDLKAPWDGLREKVSQVFIGMPHVVDRVFICLLCGGHMLLEGVPGTAKTHLLNVIAKLLGLSFSRVQFTSDLMPSDLVGTMIYNPAEHSFSPKLGPIMTNFLLADEVNRAPAKVQSALLEVMAEHQVTLGEKSYPVPEPFFVCASQNPVEQEGTFYLPEAQKDRFFFKINLGYLTYEQECMLLRAIDGLQHCVDRLEPVMSAATIIDHQKQVERVYVDEKIMQYIVRLVQASRLTQQTIGTQWLDLGGSPRASIALYRGSRAKAFLEGRTYVIPQDVVAIATDVLEHRVIPSVESEVHDLKPRDIIHKLLEHVAQP